MAHVVPSRHADQRAGRAVPRDDVRGTFDVPAGAVIEAELGVVVSELPDEGPGVGRFEVDAADGARLVVTFDVPARSVQVVVEQGDRRIVDIVREGAAVLSVDGRIGGCQISFRAGDTRGELIAGTAPHWYVRESTLLG